MREILIKNDNDPIIFNQSTKRKYINQPISFNSARRNRISVEVCPDRSLDTKELVNLLPDFCSITWRSQPDNILQDVHNVSAISLSKQLSLNGNQVLLHLVGRHLSKSQVINIMSELMLINVRNVFVLQGESSVTLKDKTDFHYASDLVKFIKSNYGNYFCIGVAGYADTHPLSPDKTADLKYLKLKVDSGADFIITQMIFDSKTFVSFYKECRQIGINVPIIPGICVINSYENLISMAKFCKVQVPEDIMKILSKNMGNKEAIRNYGIFLCCQLIKEIFLNNDISVAGVHFFSLNDIKLVRNVCKELGLSDTYIERPLLYKLCQQYLYLSR